MHAFVPKLVALFSVALVGLFATPIEAGTRKFPAHGFELSIPNGWTETPMQVDAVWVAAKYKGPKADRYRDKDRGSEAYVYPRMRVVVFLDEIMDAEGGASIDGEEITISFVSPFEGYIDFLKRTSPGFSQSDEGETEQNGLPVEWYEIQHTGSGVNQKLVTWVYTTEIGKIAVEFQALEEEWAKHKRDAMKLVKSLKPIEVTEDLEVAALYQSAFSDIFNQTLDAEERQVIRQEEEKRYWEKVTKRITPGWKAKKLKGVPVLTVDMGYAKKVVDRVNGIKKWLDENFDVIGQGEYVRTPLIRIFDDFAGEFDFKNGMGSRANEIATNKQGKTFVYRQNYSRNVVFANSLGAVNVTMMNKWFVDRDRDVFQSMPAWLRWGLSQLIAQAVPKGKKLTFPEGQIERDFVRRVEKDDITPVQDLMRFSNREFGENNIEARLGESLTLVRYFIDGPGSKNKATKDILPTYLRHLSEVVKEARSEKFEGADKEAETEEEEEELERQRTEWAKQLSEHVRDEAFARTFEGWTDNQWNVIEKAYRDSF